MASNVIDIFRKRNFDSRNSGESKQGEASVACMGGQQRVYFDIEVPGMLPGEIYEESVLASV